MSSLPPIVTPIVTIDIGNSRMKFGWFDPSHDGAASGLPMPTESFAMALPEDLIEDWGLLSEWWEENVPTGTPLVVGSVNRSGTKRLREFAEERDWGPWRELTQGDLPIANLTDEPNHVGIDRLAAAVAANAIRRPGRPAIVIDFGTAITVDLVNGDGAFEGGAILPGLALAAKALGDRTDALPTLSGRFDGKSPPSVGKSTTAAIESGLYWGAVGSARELIARHTDRLAASPQVLVTGSTSPDLARLFSSPDRSVRYVPHLVLAGLALAARPTGEPRW